MQTSNPIDYINYYVDILKRDFNLNDIKVDYHGLVGFIMNLFGWTNYDIKQYYDYLFKEGFLASAEESQNLYFHASKYNYNLDYATPSVALGYISFDFSKLPSRPSNIYKREIILPDKILTQATINYPFQSETKYRFFEEYNGIDTLYYCVTVLKNGTQKITPSATNIIQVPFYEFFQKESIEYRYNVPNYNYGTYHSYEINIPTGDQLCDLIVKVQKNGSSDFEQYDVKYIKAFENPLSKVVFLTRISETTILIEMGNGYHGEWIPNAIITIEVYITKGAKGNSLVKQYGTFSDSLRLVNYDNSNSVISNNILTVTSNLMSIDFYSVDGGVDTLQNIDLKNDIVKWVESRNNLINQNDFYNIFNRYNKDINILFKKNHIVDNNFYICKVIRDQYQNILSTSNYMYKCVNYDVDGLIKNISSEVQYYTTSTLTIGRYYYKIVAIDKFFKSKPTNPIIQTVSNNERAIVVSWDPIDSAEYYIIYGRTNQYNQYWVIPKDQLTIDGKIYFIDEGQEGTSGTVSTNYSIIEQINFPSFTVDLKHSYNLTNDVYDWNRLELYSNTYYVVNKVFWKEPYRILYNGVLLNKIITTSLDQLIERSYAIINNVLYLRLDSLFDKTNSDVIVYYENVIDFFSPFIYKYNKFFDWFEGYYLLEDIIQYIIVDPNYSDILTPNLYLNLIYDRTNNITNIQLKSNQSITVFSFKLKVYNVDNTFIDTVYNEENDSFEHSYDGFMIDDSKILIECYRDGEFVFSGSTPLFKQAYMIKDQLTLHNYFDEQGNKYIIDIPVLGTDQFEDEDGLQYENKDYVYAQIFDYIINSNLNQNRMQTDSVQTRFLNTIYCDSYVCSRLLKQAYDTPLVLPLNMNIKLRYDTTNLNFSDHLEDIYLIVSQYLQTKASGVDITFYPSQVVDLIHDYSPHITSVIIDCYDNYGTSVNNGIEVLSETDYLYLLNDKIKSVEYTSTYWWWDINGLKIEILS